MAGKATVITLNADMTFTEKKKKTEATNVVVDKHTSPSFELGRSVFKELIPRWRKILGRKPRELILYLSGANHCFDLDSDGKLESHKEDLWSETEKTKFINKLVLKLKAQQQILSNVQFYVIAALLGIILVLQAIIISGMPIAI